MNKATREYIKVHGDEDVRQLALRGIKEPEVDLMEAIRQIAGRQTARKKLPSWAAYEEILYPPHLSMEQCSSEETARYKASIVPVGQTLVDLTGGFGVDFSFLAPHYEKAVYVERQEELCEIARQNFNTLGIRAEIICADGETYLQQIGHASLIFLDPARRDSQGARTYGISDCTPDVLKILNVLLQKADHVLLKLSPMLDWRKTVTDLGINHVRQVHIVSVKNECKELLVFLSKQSEGLSIFCVNDSDILCYNEDYSPLTPFSAPPSESSKNSSLLTSHSPFLYEPNASIMKAGCFDVVCERYNVCQLAQNSHLFISPDFIDSFPGRKFRIINISSMNKKELKEKINPLKKANITVRNFPLPVNELRKRLKLSEGGSHYIFATTLAQGDHVLLVCEQIF